MQKEKGNRCLIRIIRIIKIKPVVYVSFKHSHGSLIEYYINDLGVLLLTRWYCAQINMSSKQYKPGMLIFHETK